MSKPAPATETAAAAVRKDDRLYIRTSREQKDVLARAARAQHLHTTEFVLQASLSAAEEVLAREERITLSERDFARFVDAIENPPTPAPGLRAALAEYDRLRSEHPDSRL